MTGEGGKASGQPGLPPTTSLEQLEQVEQRRALLADRLRSMADKKDTVSPQVYERVEADYQAQAATLDDEARGLRDRAETERRRLVAIRRESEDALASARLDLEELGFRHALGEFGKKELDGRMETAKRTVEERESALAAVTDLVARFAEVLGGAAAEEPEELATAAAAGSERQPPGRRRRRPDTTAVVTPEQPVTDAGATVVIRLAVLVETARGASGREFKLGIQPVTLGSSPEAGIRLTMATVAPEHARVSMTKQGYAIEDLGSVDGLFVNGQRVTSRLLVDDDRIRLGTASVEFVFHFRA